MMLNKAIVLSGALVVVATMCALGGLPAIAQYDRQDQNQDRNSQNQHESLPREDPTRDLAKQLDDAYRSGYRAGYDAARNTQRYDDRPELNASDRGDSNQRSRQRYTQN